MDAPRYLGNHFLIAVPAMHDPNFSRTVTLLCQHTEEGAMGLMLNRSSEYKLGDVLEQMQITTDDAALAAAPVLIGGPVQPERGFVLHDTGGTWDSSFTISDALSVTTSRDILAAMAEGKGPKHAIVALGYAGWGEGQLEQEMLENAWLTAAAEPEVIFATPPDKRWEAAASRMGIDIATLSTQTGHA